MANNLIGNCPLFLEFEARTFAVIVQKDLFRVTPAKCVKLIKME